MIFYFSGTGNTKWAVRELEKATGEESVYIPDVLSSDCRFELQADEMIGFAFPIHGWRPPLLVLKFIEKLKMDFSGHYCYALVTAGDSIGLAMDYFSRSLFSKGMHLDSCFSLIMPESYVGLPFMDVDISCSVRNRRNRRPPATYNVLLMFFSRSRKALVNLSLVLCRGSSLAL